MRRSGLFYWWTTTLALGALALGLLSLPEDFSQPIRLSARDVSRPGQAATRMMVSWANAFQRAISDWQARRVEIEALQARLLAAQNREHEYRQRLAASSHRAELAESLAKRTDAAVTTDPLFVPQFVEARVLGTETVALAASHKMPARQLIGTGKSQGVDDNLLVIEPERSTLDIGVDHGISIHQPVFAGNIVVGRTAMCGNYSCSLQPVTDAKFNGPAQLLRKTPSGLQPGAEGVLEGTGEKCRLTGVFGSESVAVGDEVYTPAADPLLPHPMFYGRIVRAEWKQGMPHWEIEVEPAAKNLRLTFVRVLKPQENAARVTAN